MLRAVAFGLAVGASVQAWRQWPPDGPVTADAAMVVFLFGLLAAYLGGLWGGRGRGGARATATATASAEATAAAFGNAVNVAVFTADPARPTAFRVPDESVSWIEGQRRQLEADELDGLDLFDLYGEEPDFERREG